MVLEFCDLCHKKEPNRRFKIKMSTTRLKEIADISQTATLIVNKGEWIVWRRKLYIVWLYY